MFGRNNAPLYGYGSTNMGSFYQANPAQTPQWSLASGKVVSYTNSGDIFRGDEILEVSVVDASLMDVSSVTLGRQRIQLQYGQRFPIRFQFYYDRTRVGPGYGGSMMQARITKSNGQLLYINDTQTPLKNNVKIDVKRV